LDYIRSALHVRSTHVRIYCLTVPCSAAAEGGASTAVLLMRVCLVVVLALLAFQSVWRERCAGRQCASFTAALILLIGLPAALLGGFGAVLDSKDGNVPIYFQETWHPGTSDGVPCASFVRLGNRGDGGKAVCTDEYPPTVQVGHARHPAACRVLSIGSNGDLSFETALHAKFPQCAVDVYDGTMGERKLPDVGPWLTFHPENWHTESWRRHQGDGLWLVKMDCERCEYEGLLPLLEHVCVGQIQLELHATRMPLESTKALLKAINASHGVFYNEPNILYTDGTTLELAWRRRRPQPHGVGGVRSRACDHVGGAAVGRTVGRQPASGRLQGQGPS